MNRESTISLAQAVPGRNAFVHALVREWTKSLQFPATVLRSKEQVLSETLGHCIASGPPSHPSTSNSRFRSPQTVGCRRGRRWCGWSDGGFSVRQRRLSGMQGVQNRYGKRRRCLVRIYGCRNDRCRHRGGRLVPPPQGDLRRRSATKQGSLAHAIAPRGQ